MPKLIEIEQGTQAWKSWRRCHITASDAAKICGVSRFGDKCTVYDSKINLVEIETNRAMERGQVLEVEARNYLNSIQDKTYLNHCYESTINPVFGCSLDAYNGEDLIEIKSTGAKFDEIKETKKLEKDYIYQCNFQMMVMEMDQMLVMYVREGLDYFYIDVQRDHTICDEIEEKCMDFWNNHILTEQHPVSDELEDYIARYRELDIRAKSAQQEMKEVKDHIIYLSNETPFKSNGVSLSQSTRKTVKWESVAKELNAPQDIIETYTVESKPTWTIRVSHKD